MDNSLPITAKKRLRIIRKKREILPIMAVVSRIIRILSRVESRKFWKFPITNTVITMQTYKKRNRESRRRK
jgi:hypothetical protein